MPNRLSERSHEILHLFALGYNHDQVMSIMPTATYLEICEAMHEALQLLEQPGGARAEAKKLTFPEHVQRVREERPNAWQGWTRKQEQQLKALRSAGLPLEEIARRMDRTRGAIMARLIRMEEQGELPE